MSTNSVSTNATFILWTLGEFARKLVEKIRTVTNFVSSGFFRNQKVHNAATRCLVYVDGLSINFMWVHNLIGIN